MFFAVPALAKDYKFEFEFMYDSPLASQSNFNIYMDEIIICGQLAANAVPATDPQTYTLTCQLGELSPGSHYIYMTSVDTAGVESQRSNTMPFTVPGEAMPRIENIKVLINGVEVNITPTPTQ